MVTEVRMVVTSGVIDWEGIRGKLLECCKFSILIKVVIKQVSTYAQIHQV